MATMTNTESAQTTRTPLRTPPGPKGGRVLGNFVELRRDFLGFLADLVREYGDVATFRIAHIRTVLVNDPELIEHVLVRDAGSYRKAWDYRQIKFVLGEGLLTSEGEFHKRQRALSLPAFRHDRIAGYADVFASHAERTAESWFDGSTRQTTIDVNSETSRLALDVVAETLFGSDVGAHADVVSKALHATNRQFEAMFTGVVPLPMWFPTPGNFAARRGIRRLKRVIDGLIQDRRRNDRGPSTDLLSMLLSARDDDGRGMSDRQLRDEVMTVFLAGHETTAIALAFCFWLIARHPAVEQKLLDEYADVLGGRPATAVDVPRLTYTTAVIKEAMRLYPPAWSFGREAVSDTMLGDFAIPRGTQILIAQWLVHRDARYFDAPDDFRPERWLDDLERRNPRYAYFPFGGGSRACIGAGFAMMEMAVILPTILRRVRFEDVPGQKVDLLPAVTLRPRTGIELRVERRA